MVFAPGVETLVIGWEGAGRAYGWILLWLAWAILLESDLHSQPPRRAGRVGEEAVGFLIADELQLQRVPFE